MDKSLTQFSVAGIVYTFLKKSAFLLKKAAFKNMNYFDIKKTLENKWLKRSYKYSVIAYSLYFAFSAQVFAQQVEAPSHDVSIAESLVSANSDEDGEHKLYLKEKSLRIAKIEAYYNRYDLPLAAHAKDFVEAAEYYDIDWTLLAAIGMIESTGGKHACSTATYSAFGWGSCKINFDSYAESIDVISKNLAGGNPRTARYYKDKAIKEKLQSYNPPHIVADYADKVMREMERIKSM